MYRFASLASAGLLVALALAFGNASAQDAVIKKTGGVMTNAAGMTVYTFDKDSGGKSACNGGCATTWPPLAAPATAKPVGDLTVLTREDGTRQWAYKGKPLYLWSKDQKPGDKTGDNLNNAWHVVAE